MERRSRENKGERDLKISRGKIVTVVQDTNRDFLLNVLENKMNLDMGAIEISKVVRLGKREAGQTKRRPIRFTVNQFDHKRQILKANNLLRKSEDVVYSNIYFTPDLTKNQRKQAYE